MAITVLGVFNSQTDAENAIDDLKEHGYNPKDLSIVMKDNAAAREVADNTGANVASGAISGATTGGVVGAIAGLLIGIGAITIPGIGALLIAGPLATALGLTGAAATTVSGAATGALAGGLIGALTGLGVPREDAQVYEERVRSGAILLAVPARASHEDEVREILDDNAAEQVRVVNMRGEEEHHARYAHHA
jgi:uncharacterized membrane protein